MSLEYLSIDGTEITELDIRGLEKLEKVQKSENQVVHTAENVEAKIIGDMVEQVFRRLIEYLL